VLLLIYIYIYDILNSSFGLHVDHDLEFELGHLMHFSFHELQNATDNFNAKNILGQGGFGIVYKGCLRNGTLVAVKRLKDPDVTGEVQFQTEVELIGLAVHRNLLHLYGFCMTSKERLLVYPYMPNGSVADRLRGNLNWPQSLFSFHFSIPVFWFCASVLLSCVFSTDMELKVSEYHHGKPSLDWSKRIHGSLLGLPGDYFIFMNNAILRSFTGMLKLQIYCLMKVLKQSLGILDWQNFLTDKNHTLLLLFGALLGILLLSISQLGSLQKKLMFMGLVFSCWN
jgi:hypothetical protein